MPAPLLLPARPAGAPARARPRRTTERGQAAVELALALPLVALLLLAVVQVGVIVRDQVLVVHAAREAARAAAVDPRTGTARAAALAGSGLEASRLAVELHPGDRVGVVISYRAPTSLPLIGPLVPDLTLRAKAAMRSES
jgi:Flp pilus assembly protein TadG